VINRWWMAALMVLAPVVSSAAVQSDWAKTNSNVALTPPYNINLDTSSEQVPNPAFETSFHAIGDTVNAFRTVGGTTAGSYKVAPGHKISKSPIVVKLKDGKFWAFFTSTDGKLHKVAASDLALASATTVDLKRGLGCVPDDSLVASPTIQIAAYSTGLSQDLVIVPTFHGCGDHSLNQVVAFDAGTMAEVWRFNTFGEYQVDYFSEGCSLDYTRNRVYCGANLEAGRNHNTLFAIRTAAENGQPAGSVVWAVNSNAVRNRPQLGYQRGSDSIEHLYVADHIGVLHAYDPATGAEHWQVPLTAPGVNITQNIWSEFRDPYAMMVFVTDTAGDLHAVYDPYRVGSAEEPFLAWSRAHSGSIKVMSLGSVSPTLGKLYAGFNNGTVHQINISNGTDEASYSVSNTPLLGDVVLDPTLHIQGGNGDINKMVATSYGASPFSYVKQFPVPFVAVTGTILQTCSDAMNPADPNEPNPSCKDPDWYSPAGCKVNGAGMDCCSVGRCKDGLCYAAIRPGGAPAGCTDGRGTCTTGKMCKMGTCVGKWNPSCTQGATLCPDPRACGPGKMCYKPPFSPAGIYQCVDKDGGLAGDGWKPCGSNSRTCDAFTEANPGAQAWGGDRVCKNGRCVRNNNQCGGIATPAQIDTALDVNGVPATAWASGLVFDKTAAGCNAYLSSYRSPGANAFGPYSTAVNLTGPGCGLACTGAQSASVSSSGTTATGNFTDPIPPGIATGTYPVRVRVIVEGNVVSNPFGGGGCQYGTLSVAVNGRQIGSANVAAPATCVGLCLAMTQYACSTLIDVTGELMNGGIQDAAPWVTGGVNSFTLSSPATGGGSFRVGRVTLIITSSNGQNWVRRVNKAGAVDRLLPSRAHPGYMHGIDLGLRGVSPAEVLTAYVNRPDPDFPHTNGGQFTNLGVSTEWAGIGRGVPSPGSFVKGIDATSQPINVNIPALPTSCVGSACSFLLSDYNYGPAPPSGDKDDSSFGRVFYGNYRKNGDVWGITKTSPTWSASEIGASQGPLPAPGCAAVHTQAHLTQARCVLNSDCPSDLPTCADSVCTKPCTNSAQCAGTKSPVCRLIVGASPVGFCAPALCAADADCAGVPNTPTCTRGVCTKCDRVTATAVGTIYNFNADDVLRVAVGPRIFFYDLANQGVVAYWVDLSNPAQPTPDAAGAGRFWGLGFRNIETITSMTIDPLNKTRDLYIAAREQRPASAGCNGRYQDFIHLRGDDFAVRPLGKYIAEDCSQVVPGTLEELYPTGRVPTNMLKANDMRITASSSQDLYYIMPVRPSNAAAQSRAKIDAYDLLP
jgi:hypothetical protein